MRRVLRKNGVLFAIERLPDKVDGLTKERAIAHREPTEKEEPTLRFCEKFPPNTFIIIPL